MFETYDWAAFEALSTDEQLRRAHAHARFWREMARLLGLESRARTQAEREELARGRRQFRSNAAENTGEEVAHA